MGFLPFYFWLFSFFLEEHRGASAAAGAYIDGAGECAASCGIADEPEQGDAEEAEGLARFGAKGEG
jgi:hypothetical protein